MNFLHRGCIGDLEGEHVLTYHFFKNLRATVEQFDPDKLFFCLEGHPKHRYAMYPEYKANRIVKLASASETKKSMKQKVLDAVEPIVKILLHHPCTLISHPDYEADDVIATLCDNMKDEDITVISGDTDLIQLLQMGYQDIKLYSYNKKDYLAAPEYPYLAWKTLRGDKGDNIPSITGPKKTEKLLANPDLFQQFMDKEENRANFMLNKQLIELCIIPFDNMIIRDGIPNWYLVQNEFKRMEFNSMLNSEDYWDRYIDTYRNMTL